MVATQASASVDMVLHLIPLFGQPEPERISRLVKTERISRLVKISLEAYIR
jgi:hypothetical protein